MFYPVNSSVAITDGSAAPGTLASPTNLRNFTPFHRSGGDVSVDHAIFQRGSMGRVADEYGYLRRYAVSISDLTLEQDDTATTGTTVLFDMGDVHTANERIFQRTYESGHTRTVACLVGNVGDGYADDDVMMYNVTLQATGTLAEIGF